MGKFAPETQNTPLVLNAVLAYSAEFEITVVEVTTQGEQRYSKAFAAAGISVFFDKRVVGMLLATPSCISAEF